MFFGDGASKPCPTLPNFDQTHSAQLCSTFPIFAQLWVPKLGKDGQSELGQSWAKLDKDRQSWAKVGKVG